MDIQKEREAFEVATNIYHCIYNADLNYYFSGSKFVGEKAEIEVNAGWKAWQAAKAQANKQFENFIDQAIEDSACADERRSLQALLDEFQEQANG